MFFEKQLMQWFTQRGRKHLPWRKKRITAYEVWVSEIMLQQTQVSRVIDYYTHFLKRFPTVESLSKATWKQFLPYYAGLGYYRRGENMLKTAKIVVDEHHGKFPRDKKTLMKLPGVGEYTASAILSFAFGEDHLAWDTNLQKVFGRFFYGEKNAEVDQKIFEKKLLSDKRTLNAAIMDFSSEVCRRDPKCSECPLKEHCEYFRTSGTLEAKSKKKRGEAFPAKDAQAYVFLHRGHREYFSAQKQQFSPFVLPPSANHRDAIKLYFREKHALLLAVRPPHKKCYVDGIPTLMINAQILLGKHRFAIFDKKDVRDMMEELDITE
ncbi:A/G-specific adenine glycosylase [Candidatus Nomurabacteria bacterium]|nr:A/G-specific adenine glycosylase [Candidatus Nomurabacteria bacterium]